MYTLKVVQSFDAAHCIPDHPGKCKYLHGHTYKVEAEFTGDTLDKLGMVMDFGDLKKTLKEILPDHRYLNDELDGPTTAEYIAEWIYHKLEERALPVVAVTLWETEGCGCRYTK